MLQSKGDEKIQVIPVDNRSQSIYEQKEHAFIGISPFSGYFTIERITKLINWGMNNFENITVFIPDKISSFTLQGKGYSEKDAVRKTKSQDKRLKNKVIRSFEELGIRKRDAENNILTFTEISNNPRYIEIYENCLKLFETDTSFKLGCLGTSKEILSNNEDINNEEKLNIAVKYFLHEFPLFINTPFILDIPSSLIVYHAPPIFVEHLYQSRTLVPPNQGFLKVIVN